MLNRYLKNVWIFLLSFTFLYADSSSALSSRMSLSLKDNGKLTVSTNYTTNAIFRGIDSKTGREGGAVLIEPTIQVVKFDIDVIENIEWDGFIPNVDWKFDMSIEKSKKETSIDLSKYILPKNTKWENMDISIRQGGIATLISNIRDYGVASNKSVDSLLLTGLDALKLAELIGTTLSSAKSVGIKGKNGKITQEIFDKIKKFSNWLNSGKSLLNDVALWAEYANLSFELMDSFLEVASLDEEVKKELEKEPIFIEFKRYSENIKKISKDISKSLGGLGTLADKSVKSNFEKRRSEYFKKITNETTAEKAKKAFYTKTLEEYKKALTKEDKSLILLNALQSPAKDILKLYKISLQKKLKNATDNFDKKEEKKISKKLRNLDYGEGILYVIAILYSKDDNAIEKLANDPEKVILAVTAIGQAVISTVADNWAKNTIKENTVLITSVSKVTNFTAQVIKGKTTYLKAVTLGNDIANKMIPFIWDIAFAPKFLQSSIIKGKINPYGKMETEIKIYNQDTLELLYTVSNGNSATHNPTIELEEDDKITVVVGLKRPKMFDKKRSPWLINRGFPARALYDATIIMPNKRYRESVLCAMNPWASKKHRLIYSVYNFSGKTMIPNSNMCGVNDNHYFTSSDEYGWYEKKPTNQVFYADSILIPEKHKLPNNFRLKEFHNSIIDSSSGYSIVTYANYIVTENEKDDIEINVQSLDSNIITHKIHIKIKGKLDVDAGGDINTYKGLDNFSTISLKTENLLDNTKIKNIVWKDGEKTLCTLNKEGEECLVKIDDLIRDSKFTVFVTDTKGNSGKDTIKVTCYDTNDDIDGDDIPDVWEINNKISTYNQFGGINSNDNRMIDSDGDGVRDYFEYIQNTNPKDANDFLNLVTETKIKKVGDRYILLVGIDPFKVTSSMLEEYSLALVFYNDKYAKGLDTIGVKGKIYKISLNKKEAIYAFDVTSLLEDVNKLKESMPCSIRIFYEKGLDTTYIKEYYGEYEYDKSTAKFIEGNNKLLSNNIKIEKFKKGEEEWIRIENDNSFDCKIKIKYDAHSGMFSDTITIDKGKILTNGLRTFRIDNSYLDETGKHNDFEFIIYNDSITSSKYTISYEDIKKIDCFEVKNVSEIDNDGIIQMKTSLAIDSDTFKFITIYHKTQKRLLHTNEFTLKRSGDTISIKILSPLDKDIYILKLGKGLTARGNKLKISKEYAFEKEYKFGGVLNAGVDQTIYETQVAKLKPIVINTNFKIDNYLWKEEIKNINSEYVYCNDSIESCEIPNLKVGLHTIKVMVIFENLNTLIDEVNIKVLPKDTDNDTDKMPDIWENQYSYDANHPDRPYLDINKNDADGDADGDGVSNYQEYLDGTNPIDINSVTFILDIETKNDIVKLKWNKINNATWYGICVSKEPIGDRGFVSCKISDWGDTYTVVDEDDNGDILTELELTNLTFEKPYYIKVQAFESILPINTSNEKIVILNHNPINTPPTAKATANKTEITKGESVILDGSQSSDADGDALTYYKWVDDVSNEEKIGKTVTFDNLSVGEHKIKLTVSDGNDLGSVEIVILVKEEATPITKIPNSTLKKTSQTISYAKYDDGFYEKGITPNYTQESADILDRMTGIVWQNSDDTNGSKKSWSDAKDYCGGLTGGWRLPTRQELSGLVRYDKYNPSIDDIFDYTTADYYWTEDVSLRDENKVWAVSFNEGTEATVAKTGSYSVRCVKKLSLAVANAGADQMAREKESVTLDGSHSPNREDIVSYKWSEGATALGEGEKFSISTLPDGVHKITLTVKDKNGKTDSDEVVITVTSEKDILKKTSQNISYAKFDDGFYEKGVALNYAKSGDNILDKSTGLIWQDSDSGKKLWGEAEGYCASLDGHWRLPTRRELSNLVSYNRYSPSIDDIFSSTTSDYYWTIDTNKRDHDKAWAISFSEGVESALAKSSSYYVRCVQNNLEPIANAGVDQLVVEGQPVVLRATESSRRELIKSYVWLEGDKELGQGAVFEPENMIDGEHQITLVIRDESGNELSRDSLRVTIISDNRVLKQTGQNISYAKFDDGYYEKGIALNYTKRDDDILDRTTGLLWQDTQESKENTNSWQDAKEYCNSLDGHWRLPTRKELSNLVRYNRYNPSIDDIFSFTTSDYYWTIDTSIRDRDKAWAISFSEGVESTVAKSSSYYARCVQSDFIPTANAGADILITKGTPTLLDASNSPRKNLIDSYLWENSGGEVGDKERSPIDTSSSGRDKITLTITDKEGRTDIDDLWLTIVANNKIVKKTGQTESYADYDDGDYQKGVSLSYSDHGDSVTDNATELEWKDDESTNSIKMTWKEANEYCSRDDSNWRLPTRHELSSLVDYSAYNPSINSSFDNTASDYYWSVDTSMRDNDKAWAVSFSEGVESTIAKSGSYYVRCINAN